MADADANSLDATILTRDAALLKDTVREAGALAQSMFRTELKTWTKGASSPVSEADIAVNDLLEARLRSATPDYGWLSEESADDSTRLSRRLVWVVDPIDGTRNYLGGHDEWCVSVALVEDAAPLLAAVFAPASGEFFFAARGQGTLLNDKPVRATPGSTLDFSRMAGPSRWSSVSIPPAATSSCTRESARSRSGSAGSPMARWMRLLRAATAMIGILRRPI
ncbi:inositol monophosphatase family protein [Bradyrhizobium diazoefficiens]|uniref:Inositol monophosphatase family protein n=1 Tax=Bradyrhizobium diazoefficiens TaxID=1355477 RepID=A0A0E3VV72_9BRAD|nr:inositol monophosphatase family protein [Bradyrhizobium diazoefficiens]